MYHEWKAVIHCGGNIDHLLKWDNGDYPIEFRARVIAFYQADLMIERHSHDEARIYSDKQAKKNAPKKRTPLV